MSTASITFNNLSINVKGQGGVNYGNTTASSKNWTGLSSAFFISSVYMSYSAEFGASKYSAGWTWDLQVSYDGGTNWSSVGFSGSQGGIAGTYNLDASQSYANGLANSNGQSLLFGHTFQLRLACSAERSTSYWAAVDHHLNLSNITLTFTYTERGWITFTGTGVTTETNAVNYGAKPAVPSVDVTKFDVGYTFDKWRCRNAAGTGYDFYDSDDIPASNGTDVTYTTTSKAIPYYINVQTVDQDGTSIAAPDGQTGNKTYYIDGDNIICAAPSGDYVISNTETYVFQSWSFYAANGAQITSTTNATYNGQALNSSNISTWFPNGADTVIAKAYYQRVYDISLNIGDPSDGDPAGVGKNGIVSISVVSDGKTQTYTKDQVLTGSIVARVDNPAVQIHTTFTAANEYEIFSTAFYGVPSGSTEYTKSWQGAAYVVSGTVTTSNWYFNIRAWKRYFDLNMSSDTDGVLKVYSVSSNGVRSLISPTHIPRTTEVEIEADGELMLQKTHDTAVTSITPNTNTSVANGKGIITSLLQNHTITVARTQVNCTMSTIVNSGEPTDETVVRSNSYRYNVAAEAGWTISSATLTMRGTQIQSWQNVESIDYTIQSVTGNCVLTVNRVQNPQAYVTIQTPTSSYGTVNVVGATSVLKTEFNGFTVSSVTALPAYEVVAATYRWMVGATTVGTGTINPTTGTTIQYPNATIPGDQDVVLVVDVQYRKNIVYHSQKINGTLVSKRPQSLWYTPVGQAPQRVVAVYAQTASHPAPILLFGDVE